VENDGTFTYFVSVRNDGPDVINFSWEGGGATNKVGNVVGSARTGKSEDGQIEVGTVPLRGQKVHKVDVTSEIDKIESPVEKHKALGKLIKKK
jgi:hypothetical protein